MGRSFHPVLDFLDNAVFWLPEVVFLDTGMRLILWLIFINITSVEFEMIDSNSCYITESHNS
jgi:hypothetical protein